jgi:phosphatidylglycerol lysyltransferase
MTPDQPHPTSGHPDDPDRLRVLALLRAHGWNATSFQILEPGFRYWFDEDDACVGYVDTGEALVVAGAPVAPLARLREVTQGFVSFAQTKGRRACFFATESRFREALGWPTLRIGDQPVWASEDWLTTVSQSRSLREQLRRARAKGITVRLLDAGELAPAHPTRAKVDLLIARWLATRPMAPMGFLVQVHPYAFPEERYCFVAELGESVVGFLGVIPVYSRDGWFFEDFLNDPTAPNGTIELLIDAAMRAAANARVSYVTMGLVPLMGDVHAWLRVARRLGRFLYDFDGLRAFKAKFKPCAWDPIFLSYPPGATAWRSLLDTLAAFSRGELLGFGLRTLLRGPAIVMRALAVLLVPWIILLSLPASAAWFPSEACRWSWVGFDVVVGIALYRLSARWQPRLAELLACAVTLDAVLTLLQAVVYDLPRRRSPGDLVIVLIAILAPTVAAVLLWNSRAHRDASWALMATRRA